MRQEPASLILSSRSHIADLDAARGVLMLLGLVLHSADVYRVGRWVVHDPSGNVAFDWLVTAIHLFRMPAFFWISGFFAALSLDRAVPADFFKRRFQRLVYPMVATMLTFNLLQQVVLDHLPPENIKQPTIFAHLWFLVDLLIYSALAALVMTKGGPLDRAFARLLRGVQKPASLICILATATAIPILGVATLSKLAGQELDLWDVTSLDRLAANAVYFTFGMVSYRSRALRDVLYGIHPAWFLPAIGIGVWASQAVQLNYFVLVLLRSVLVWLAVGAVLSLFRRAFNQPSGFKLWLADASYPIYLSHHFFVILFAGLLLTSNLVAPVKFALVLGLTSCCSAAFAQLARNVGVLHWMYLGRPMPRVAVAAAQVRPVVTSTENAEARPSTD
jgi:glucan biosynthesis protein C